MHDVGGRKMILKRNSNNNNKNNIKSASGILSLSVLLAMLICTCLRTAHAHNDGQSLEQLFVSKENALLNLCKYAQRADTYDASYCSFYNACDRHIEHKLPSYECTSGFGSDSTCGCGSGMSTVSTSAPVLQFPVLYPPEAKMSSSANWITNQNLKDYLCIHANLSTAFQNNYKEDIHLAWQYFASDEGAFSLYPGHPFSASSSDPENETCRSSVSGCKAFDARFRPWYISAVQDWKVTVIVVDTSAAMKELVSGANDESDKELTLMHMAKTITENLIRSFRNIDRVGVVTMREGKLDACEFSHGGHVAQGDSTELQQCIENSLKPHDNDKGAIDYDAALQMAQNIVEETQEENPCQSAILMISASESSKMPNLKSDEWNSRFNKTIIFTCGFAGQATRALIDISCHNGIHMNVEIPKTLGIEDDKPRKTRDISLEAELRSVMSPFYRYFAYTHHKWTGQEEDKELRKSVVWVDAFQDTFGLGNITTASMACPSSKREGQILGVAGIDVPISQFSNFDGYEEMLKKRIDRIKKCQSSDLTDDALNMLRGGTCNACRRDTCILIRFLAVAVPVVTLVIVASITSIGVCLVMTIYRTRLKIQNRKAVEMKDKEGLLREDDEDDHSDESIDHDGETMDDGDDDHAIRSNVSSSGDNLLLERDGAGSSRDPQSQYYEFKE